MELLRSHFENCSIGPLRKSCLKRAFPGAKSYLLTGKVEKMLLNLKLKKSAVSIVKSKEENLLKVVFPGGKFGPLPGAQWKVNFQETESAHLKYKVYIPSGFEFAKGGKLPGLGGGKGNTGGQVPDGYDGWSVRFMFKEAGRLCAYLYYPGMPDKFGEKWFLKAGENDYVLPRDKWVEIGLTVKMNNPGKPDGRVECYINGILMLTVENIEFRRTNALKADHLFFSSFFGGADSSYAPMHTCFLLFKEFSVDSTR